MASLARGRPYPEVTAAFLPSSLANNHPFALVHLHLPTCVGLRYMRLYNYEPRTKFSFLLQLSNLVCDFRKTFRHRIIYASKFFFRLDSNSSISPRTKTLFWALFRDFSWNTIRSNQALRQFLSLSDVPCGWNRICLVPILLAKTQIQLCA